MAAFRHDGMVNYQIQYIPRRDALPIVRQYIQQAEANLHQGKSAERSFQALTGVEPVSALPAI